MYYKLSYTVKFYKISYILLYEDTVIWDIFFYFCISPKVPLKGRKRHFKLCMIK